MGKYDDIIDLPHPVSEKHPHMSMYDRAAQFSPFDALTGYSESIDETARTTDRRLELSDEDKAVLDGKLSELERLCAKARSARFYGNEDACFPKITVTYFVPDKELHRRSRKTGGSFLKYTGTLRTADTLQGFLVFENESGPDRPPFRIPLRDICDISGEVFEDRR
ncbi:MAG: hypothetical protein II441_01795 [Oscillospiraceae bacterium]|nr:hypothetical protein [Oscillospiraceae bacterium]